MRKLLTLLIVAILATTTASAADKITDYTKIVSGKTYRIGATTASKDYYFSVDGTKAATSIAGKAVEDVSNASLFVFEGEGTSWTVKFANSDFYLALDAENKSNGNVIVTSNSSTWTLSNQESLIRMMYGSTYALQKNNSGAQFGSYKATQTDIWLEEVVKDSRTKTSLVWSAANATADLSSDTNSFPTLTKDPENLSGISYSSSNTDVATIDQTTGAITLVGEGTTTIEAAFAGDETYATSSAKYTLSVIDNKVTPGTYTIALNNAFWGTNYNGTASGITSLRGNTKGISITLNKTTNKSSNMYVNDTQTRAYNNYYMTFAVPAGYEIKKINFTSVGTNWNGEHTSDVGTMQDNKNWTGNANAVTIYFSGTCQIKNVIVTYAEATATKNVESIAISGTPTKTSYEVGDVFDPTGLTVTATYSDKTTEDVTENVEWTFDPATISETTESVIATATYEGKTAEEIYELKSLSSIAITGTPTKTTYNVGEAFDLSGLTVTATYSDNSTADVTSTTKWDIDPTTFTTEGSTTVTALATYESKTDIQEYTVTAIKLPLTLTITPATGTYKTAQTVTIEAKNAIGDYTIYYTTDGSDPAVNGEHEYTEPFTVSTTTTVKAYVIDNDSREATAESVITIEEKAFVAENFSNCNNQGGRDGKFNQGTGTISDANFDNTGWTYSTTYEAKSCVRVGSVNKNGSLTSPAIKRTNYNAISFDLAGWDGNTTNKLTLTINNGGTFADGSTSKAFTATNGAWTTLTETIKDLTPATTFTFSGKRFFLDSIILQNLASLAALAENGVVGSTYTVKGGDMVAVAKFEVADKHYVVVKDNATAVKNLSAPADGDKFFDIAGQKQQDYTQNNWMLVEMPVEQYNTVEVFKSITSISGTLTDAQNIGITASAVVMGEASEPFTISAYCPVNFMGVSSVASNNAAHPASYYFATPKANEYARIVWAVYNGTDGAFYIPAQSGSVNTQDFKGGFKVDFSMNVEEAPELTDGSMYEFEAVVREAATSDSQSAPRKVEYDSTVAPSSKYVVYPINLQGSSNVVTGVSDIAGAKAVKSVRYFSVTGVEAAQPFEGVNIVVTTYTDGTSSAQKMLR